jgi:hypothetical protein
MFNVDLEASTSSPESNFLGAFVDTAAVVSSSSIRARLVLGLDEDVTDSSAVAGAESTEVVSFMAAMGRCSSSDRL